MASKSEAYNHLVNIANKGQKNRNALKGSVANAEMRRYNTRVDAYNKLIDEYQKNKLQKNTVDSVASTVTRGYKPSDYGNNEARNNFSSQNVLKSAVGEKSFEKMNATDRTMSGVAKQIITDYRYNNEWNNKQKQDYRANQLEKAQSEYETAKDENRIARRKVVLHMYNDKGEGTKYEETRTALAQKKEALKNLRQQDYTATQQENAAKLESNKELAKMIDLGAQVKLNKKIMTVATENAQVENGQSPMAKRTLDYAQWKTYKKQLGKMGYSDKDIDNLIETRINQINGEVYEGNQALGEVAPVLSEGIRLAAAPKNAVTNIIDTLRTMATDKVQAGHNSYALAGLKNGIGNFAEEKNVINLSGLGDTENNNVFKINDKNELEILGNNYGNINRLIYNNIDQSLHNIMFSILSGGGITGGILATTAKEAVLKGIINTEYGSNAMGEELAERLYNGEEASQAFRTAKTNAAENWLSEMISPLEMIGISPNTILGKAGWSGLTEGFEELFGNWIDRTWDYMKNGRASEISQEYQGYIDKGMSRIEALKHTLKGMLADDANAFLQAFFSGFAMTGVSAVNESVQKNTANKITGAEIYKNQNETTLIEEAKKINSGEIQKLVKKAEKAKTNGAKQKTRGELLNAIQEHNIKANNKEAYDTVYKTIAKHSNSTKVATEVAEAVVNGKKAKNTVAKQYVQDIESNNSRLAKRINDRLETIDYGTNVRQAYANTLTSEKSKSFEEYTQGLPTPQQLYNDVSAIRTSEFAKQDEEKQKVKSELENRLQNRAETLTQENSQEEIAKENKQALDDSTKGILNKGETADYSDVSGIASVDNGVVLLNTKDGDTVALNNVDFGNNKEDKALFNLSSAFGDAANTFIANYKVNHQGENINTYFDRAQLAYNSGLNGVEYNKVFGESTYGMSEAEAKAFYDEGTKQAKAVAKNKAFKEKVKKMGKGVHIMDDVNLTEEQSKEVEVLSKIVEGTAAKIVIAKSSNSAGVAKSNGYYDQNAIVIFAKEAGNAITSYAGHELTHYLKENVSKELYDDYHNFVIEQLKSKGENIYNDLVNAYANAYDYDPQTQMQSIEEEMVADNGLAVFSDEKALTTLAKENRTLLEKIHDFFKQFIDKLKDIKLKLSKSSAVYATINHDIDYLEQSAQKIRTMLDNVQNTNVQSKEKFSLDVNLSETDFESNIKKVANMKSVADLDGTEFSKGDTDLVTQVTEYFNSIGNKVDSKFGIIKLTRTGIKSSVAHGIGRNKAIAFKAVPDVLKHGEIIDYTENYKNSKKDRAVIAAPITIANQDYNVATVIEINSIDNTFYLHELALQNKKDVLPFKTEPRHSNGLLSDNTSSIYTLLEKLQDVNTKYSKNTLDSEGNELTEQQQEYFKNVAKELRDEDGRIKPFYHGTARADRVGYYFDPKRATSGPMAYFTDNEKIAGNYSRNKADTSLAYDSDYDSYDTQFRKNGKPIAEYWNSLNVKDKNELTNKIKQVTLDDEDNIVLEKNNKYGIGNFNDYELHNAKGNSIKVLVDGWLNDGTLWDEEERFIDVLNAVGISDVEYKNPDYREEKVYKVYLNITKPIVTTKISEDFINGLNSYLENTDLTKYNNVTANADMWDKNNIAIDEWIDKLTDDIANHTTYSWTSIPDVVTDFLKSNGYDGIIDEGGKGGGEGHTVAIPFYSNQIKLTDNLNPTDKSDIRYSKDTNVDEFDYANYNEIKLGKKEYAIVSSAIVTKFTNKYSDELRSINYGDYIYSFVYNEDGVKFYERYNIDKYLKGLNEYGIYRKSKDNNRLSGLLKFAERDNSSSFGGNENRKSTGNVNSFDRETLSAEEKSNGIGYIENVDNDKQSRNTRLTLDDNIEDVNEAFLSAVKVLQNVHIDDIDLSSEVVTKAENAAKHIQNEVKKSGYRTQKLTGKGSVRSIATDLSEKYGNGKVTKSLVSELAELYDYIANSEVTDMSYVNSQAKIIANELINAKEETLVSATDKAPTQLLEELKRPVRIDESTKNQLAYDYGNWENAKRYISQFLNIDQKANDSALTLYEDLMSEYSDYINNEGDSVMNGKSAVDKLVDFAERTQDVIVNSYDNELAQTGFISEYDENDNLIGQYNSIDEFETAVASDIFDNFFDVEQVKNAIDKLKTEQKDKIRALREQAKEEKAVIRQTYKELYNQKLANEKQKYAESKEFYNQKLANEKQKLVNYKQYKKEVAERGRERKQTNLYKKRILRLKVQIERQLLNPKGANYVPRELVRSMADVCDIITGANVFNKNGTARSGYEALLSLQDRYQKLKNDPDYDYSSEYNEDMEQRLSDLKDSLKGKQLSNLSNSEMQNVYEIVKGISTSLSQAKKLINSSIKISAHQSAVELIKQQYATKGKGHTPFGKLDYDMLNVMRYVNLISEGNKDGILNKLFDDLNRGERKKDYLIMKWQKPFDELVKDNKNYKKFRERVIETPFIDVYGNKAKLTEAQIVQLIASAKREQGRNHLSGGGFVALDTKKAFKKGTTKAKIDGTKVENIADNLIPIISELSNKLSPYAQKWLNLSENLFNEETKSEINETSFTLKGFKIANEKYYVPLLVDKDFTNAQLEGIMRDKSLENAGFTKETNKFAKNRIIIEGIDQVVERHINNVASYVSLTVPIRNFNKVWNGQTSQYYDGFVINNLNKKYYGNKNSFSVKETIKEKWGENAQKLIENAIQDLQTTRKSNTSWIENKILNAEITATFMGNISIVLKQAASYPTAVAVLSSTSLAKGSKGFAYFTGTKKLQSLFDEIDEHTGAHYKRRIGMQTEELAALSSSQSGLMGKWANSKFGALHPAKWIQAMDVQTTAALWLATKYEVDKMSRYKKGSAEYWQAVTDLYDKVIEETQPEYDVLHRAEIQKESNFLAKTLSLFQTQPLQNSGILYNSYREVMWAKRNYKNNNSEANKKALQAARKNAVKANWAIVSAGITFSVFSFLATMLVLHKTKKYKDEDDKVTAKSVMEGIGKESVQTILSGFMPIIGSYAIEYASRILTAIKTGKLSDYDYIENMGLSAVNDLLSSIAQLGFDGFNAISGKGTLDDLKKSSKDFAKQAAQIVGIPANNIDNFIQSGTAYYHELIKKDYALWEYSSQTPTSKEQIEKYVAYINEGDKANAKERMNKWLELNQDKDKSDFESRVATYLASSDSDIVRAVQNRYSYNTAEYEKILNKVVNRGYSKQIVVSAAQSVFNKVENTAKAKFYGNTDDYEEAFNELVALGYDEKTLKKHIDGLQSDFSNDETENKVKGKYTIDELYKVWDEQGESSEAYKTMYNDILQTKIANGSDKEKAQKSIKNSIKSRYKDNSPELQVAQNAYESGDMATYQQNVNKVINQGKFDKEAIISAARGTKSYKNTLWTATDYAKAIESGNKNQALSIYKDLCKANGNEKDERQYIRSSTTTYYRTKWLNTKTAQERKDILKHLRNAGFYTNSDIESLITKWEKARKKKEKE